MKIVIGLVVVLGVVAACGEDVGEAIEYSSEREEDGGDLVQNSPEHKEEVLCYRGRPCFDATVSELTRVLKGWDIRYGVFVEWEDTAYWGNRLGDHISITIMGLASADNPQPDDTVYGVVVRLDRRHWIGKDADEQLEQFSAVADVILGHLAPRWIGGADWVQEHGPEIWGTEEEVEEMVVIEDSVRIYTGDVAYGRKAWVILSGCNIDHMFGFCDGDLTLFVRVLAFT